MRAISFGIVALAATALAMGQAGSNAITITATRSASPQPDQVVFSVSVMSSLNTGLDDIVRALDGSGIRASDLYNVYSQTLVVQTGRVPNEVVTLQWSFKLSVALSKVKETVAALNALQQKIRSTNSGLTLSYNSSGVAVSPESQAAQPCSITDLLADARAQAQKLVCASPELSVGPILALSDGGSIPVPAQAARFTAATFLLGIPAATFYLPTFLPSQNCTLVVKFSLLRYQ